VKGHSKIKLCLIFLFFLSYIESKAQQLKFTFDNVPLSEALIKSAEKFNFKVAFDADKLHSIFINRDVTGNTKEEFIQDLLLNSGYDFQYKHDNFLIIPQKLSSVEFANKECNLVGSISDKETGEQLPYASIFLFNQDLNRSTAASNYGTFSIKNIATNPVHILISLIGYYPVDTFIHWTNNSLVNCDFKLFKRVQLMDTVVIKENRLDMVDFRNNVDFATTINPSKLIDLPILAETDIFRTLQLLPGIRYSENSSELSIRGGSSDQNLVLFDGQTLYNLSHYYGVISSLNPNVIKDIQVFKGGYDSRYGERVSGIIDITGKTGNQLRPTIYGDLNLVSGNLTAEVPISKKLTVVVAGRRSYSDIYATSFSNNLFKSVTNDFHRDSTTQIVSSTKPYFYFYDYNTKISYRLSDRELLSFSLYGGKDFFDNSYTGTTNSVYVDTQEKNYWSNYGLSGTWMKQWNNSFFTNLQFGTSGYSNIAINKTAIEHPNDPVFPNPNKGPNNINTYDQNDLKDFSASFRNTYDLSQRNQLDFGILYRLNNIYYHKDANQTNIYDNFHQMSWVSSVYFQDRISLWKDLTIKPGMRLNYYNGNRRISIEPRFSANYNISKNLSVRLATGRYSQFISQVYAIQETGYNKNFWVMADDSLHPVVDANHYIIGSSYELGKFLLDAEVYYKSYSGLQEYLFDSPYNSNASLPPNQYKVETQKESSFADQHSSYFIYGKGKSYGLDLFLRYKTSAYTAWISYSLGRSLHQFPEINKNSEIPAPNDQIHQLSLTNMFSVGKWNFGCIGLFSTGRPYLDQPFHQRDGLPTIQYYKRMPDFFRCDLSANYNFKIKNSHLKIGATIINISNNTNYFDMNTRKFDYENSSFSQTTLIQSQALSLNLFLHFVL
jgi:ferric enterobactin receptor